MRGTKKAIATILLVGVAVFVIALVCFSTFNLGSMLAGTLVGTLLGETAGEFSIKACLFAIIATIIFVPSIRSEFTGSYTAGTDYKNSHKGRGGKI